MSKLSQRYSGCLRHQPKYTFKSRKHESEIAHIRHAMLKDGVALCHFFHWLEKRFIMVKAFQN